MSAPKASKLVTDRLDAGWTPAAEGLAAVSWFTYHTGRKRDSGPYRVVDLVAGERRIQVSISPTGRSVEVYVDGQPIK